MDPIKEAFLKIKEDIHYLTLNIKKLQGELNSIKDFLKNSPDSIQTGQQLNHFVFKQSDRQTEKIPSLESLKTQNQEVSIRNEGVPTDKQTNRQTIRQTNFPNFIPKFKEDTQFNEASKVMDYLDDVKIGIKKTFKNLTSQEMLVFTTLYTLEEQNYNEISYNLISQILKLSESSIRDYINKLIKKGIPIEKTKLNNKKIILKISTDLKRVTTLETIIQLRNL